ncbi:4-hydroxy-tetrahydrodipicolinate synthase [Vitreoscilla massiliensis]|uniref:4-hydroxy-tetrahydrodipicolinate synthase n=1 Tax=Vitreoscilla massiliensis TaxID=1689272 RepID=A0ABY4E3Z8_9NEIS|nr:4-hydroxy-tetrahydrodipicolinate synthase [Vitreoscilla massiliensis]UOO90227.1 4-hydroxy-tetrahydrodipicolinate synthase [Vitreoscilla massiliensis]
MKLQGIYVPLVTPFTVDNRIDYPVLEQLAELMIQKGVAGIVAFGTTGEYYSFSAAERAEVLQRIAAVAQGRVQLIVGVNDLSTAGSIEHAKTAKQYGYQALMLSAPPYSLPSQAGIIHHFETVAEAQDLPIIMYNYPDRIGVSLDFDTINHLRQHPNIIAIKESSGDFNFALQMLQAAWPDFEVMCGSDGLATDFFFWGSHSWISGAANVYPDEHVALARAALAGDWNTARAQMRHMYAGIRSMELGDYNQKAKLGIQRFGLEAGSVRMPLVDLDAKAKAEFLQLLTSANDHADMA